MLKSIGSLHNVPVPSAAVLGEFIKLLATFADKQSISTLLEHVREVQDHNEQVFREAQEAIGELAVMRKELDDTRAAFATVKVEEDLNIKRRMDNVSQAEARLRTRESNFASKQESELSAIDDEQNALVVRERTLIERESKCEEKERDVEIRLATIARKETALQDKEKQLQAKEGKFRAALDE